MRSEVLRVLFVGALMTVMGTMRFDASAVTLSEEGDRPDVVDTAQALMASEDYLPFVSEVN